MYSRWRSEAPGIQSSLPAQDESALAQARQDFFTEPLPDLESQLSAELNGASWAVVSFVPEDTAWCDWIYRALNGYPIPPEYVGRTNPEGLARPDCISVFPDRRDPKYLDHAARALQHSAYLIVVCSPQSAHSATIDENICAFKKAGGSERIIALVVDGPPDPRQGELECNASLEWLPPWLRWRCDEKGFCPADRTEPRVVDARRGRSSLQRVRDGLFTAVVDVEIAELQRLQAFKRALPELLEVSTVAVQTEMSDAFSTEFSPAPVRDNSAQRDSAFLIGTAVVLIILAVIFGVKSFRELSADDPQSALSTSPRSTPRASRFSTVPTSPLADQAPQLPEEPAGEPAVPIANVESVLSVSAPPAPATIPSEPLVSSAPPAPGSEPSTSSASGSMTAPAPSYQPPATQHSSITQVAPSQWAALTRVQPQTTLHSSSGSMAPAASAGVAAAASSTAVPSNPASTTDDAVLLDEVRTLERRGDETMAQRRTEDALDLYSTALSSAVEYANRKNANPMAKDQVVALQRKLGMLQLQNSSTAEARTSYLQARKTLLQLKSQGVWSRDRAKQLDELEARILSLPRD